VFLLGVIIPKSKEDAILAVKNMIEYNKFGDAGKIVVIEDFLEGSECSFFVFSDGKHIIKMPPAQDYKRIKDGNEGPNTGIILI